MSNKLKDIFAIILIALSFIVIVFFALFLLAKYSLWASGLRGEGELKRAEWNRQIQVREAHAKMDSAKMLAQAEVERAKGVAQANIIIGESLKNNEGYLRYLWIDSLQHTKDKIIYIPTESGLPILESHRLK